MDCKKASKILNILHGEYPRSKFEKSPDYDADKEPAEVRKEAIFYGNCGTRNSGHPIVLVPDGGHPSEIVESEPDDDYKNVRYDAEYDFLLGNNKNPGTFEIELLNNQLWVLFQGVWGASGPVEGGDSVQGPLFRSSKGVGAAPTEGDYRYIWHDPLYWMYD